MTSQPLTDSFITQPLSNAEASGADESQHDGGANDATPMSTGKEEKKSKLQLKGKRKPEEDADVEMESPEKKAKKDDKSKSKKRVELCLVCRCPWAWGTNKLFTPIVIPGKFPSFFASADSGCDKKCPCHTGVEAVCKCSGSRTGSKCEWHNEWKKQLGCPACHKSAVEQPGDWFDVDRSKLCTKCNESLKAKFVENLIEEGKKLPERKCFHCRETFKPEQNIQVKCEKCHQFDTELMYADCDRCDTQANVFKLGGGYFCLKCLQIAVHGVCWNPQCSGKGVKTADSRYCSDCIKNTLPCKRCGFPTHWCAGGPEHTICGECVGVLPYVGGRQDPPTDDDGPFETPLSPHNNPKSPSYEPVTPPQDPEEPPSPSYSPTSPSYVPPPEPDEMPELQLDGEPEPMETKSSEKAHDDLQTQAQASKRKPTTPKVPSISDKKKPKKNKKRVKPLRRAKGPCVWCYKKPATQVERALQGKMLYWDVCDDCYHAEAKACDRCHVPRINYEQMGKIDGQTHGFRRYQTGGDHFKVEWLCLNCAVGIWGAWRNQPYMDHDRHEFNSPVLNSPPLLTNEPPWVLQQLKAT